MTVIPINERVVLQRKEETSAKSLNDTLLSRLRPYRSAASAATLVALGGNETQSSRKDDCKRLIPASTIISDSLSNYNLIEFSRVIC